MLIFRIKKLFRSILLLCFVLGCILVSGRENDCLDPYLYPKKSFYSFDGLNNPAGTKNNVTPFPDYTEVYMRESKRIHDTSERATGYNRLFIAGEPPDFKKALKFSDSVINSIKSDKDRKLICYSYLVKAYICYVRKDYKQVLDLCALADRYSGNDFYLNMQLKSFMAALKIESGAFEDTLRMSKENLHYVVRNSHALQEDEYYHYFIYELYGIAKSFVNLQRPDSAIFYIKQGIPKTLKKKDSLSYYDFVGLSGEAFYQTKQYKHALDSLYKSFPHQKGRDLGITFYYMSKIFNDWKKNWDSTSLYFRKADSIFQVTWDPFKELLDAYKIQVNHYKKLNDQEKQLYYINKYLYLDSIINDHQKYLLKGIAEKYDTPKLIRQKEAIISGLKMQNKRSKLLRKVLILLAFCLAFLCFKIHRTYKKRLKKMAFNKNRVPQEKSTQKMMYDIPEIVIQGILTRLETFESEKRFLVHKLTQNQVAKDLGTNSSYLSKVVNGYKGKRFSSYINDLRIDYILERLQKDSQLRKYSVKAIGEEAGFNSTESFSRAFYKHTGMYPSYFIKTLVKKEETS